MRVHRYAAFTVAIAATLTFGSADLAQQTGTAKSKSSTANTSAEPNCAAILRLSSTDWIAKYTQSR